MLFLPFVPTQLCHLYGSAVLFDPISCHSGLTCGTILKLTERLVKNRLADHLNENNLMNSFQSAYTKFNSTETTLLAVHDHIIRVMSQQQVTGLCLLDLPAAFDTSY